MFGLTNSPLILYLLFINSDLQNVAYEYNLKKEIEDLRKKIVEEKRNIEFRIKAINVLKQNFVWLTLKNKMKECHGLLDNYDEILYKIKMMKKKFDD